MGYGEFNERVFRLSSRTVFLKQTRFFEKIVYEVDDFRN